MTEPLTARQLIHSLRSSLCPACGRGKGTRKTFCGGCYFSLPYNMRRALYNLVGEGYEEAFAEAMDTLGVEVTHLTKQAEG